VLIAIAPAPDEAAELDAAALVVLPELLPPHPAAINAIPARAATPPARSLALVLLAIVQLPVRLFEARNRGLPTQTR
jgi:hypothetical protein